MKKSYIHNSIYILLLSLFISFCTIQRSAITGKKRAYAYSWDKEKQIGKQSDKQIEQQYGFYDDKNLESYVSQVGQRVLKTSDMRGPDTEAKYRNTEFHYKVLDSPIVNAFALPGGYVYVSRGLLADLNNEAQLAVVVGHETGHVAARHSSQRALEQQIGQLALMGGAVAGQELLGVPGQSILNLGGQATQFLFLKYSRDDEREADALGVEYAAKQHYKTSDAAGFFTTLKRQSQQAGRSIPDWQSTHPDPSERANTIPELAQKWRTKGYQQNEEDTDTYMQKIDNIVYGDNPRQGFTRDGMFYHPELAFQFPYPQGWQLVNQPTAVQMVNKDQNAIIIFQLDPKSDTPRASVNEFISQDGVTGTGGNTTRNSGLNGYEATAKAQTKDGKAIEFYLYSTEYNNNIYRFVSYTLASQFDEYRDDFRRTSNQFRALHDSDILNIKPVRMDVFRTDRGGSFQSFLPQNLPMDITPKEVAIANQKNLDDHLQAGDWIKIPRQ